MSFSNRIVGFWRYVLLIISLNLLWSTIPSKRRFTVTLGGAMPHNSGVVRLNCGHSIQLPSAMRPKTGRRQEARTTDTIPLLLACPSCGHVYEYKLPRFCPGLSFTACECSDSNCKFPVAVYTVLPAGIDAEAELARRRAQWIFHGAICPLGHPLGTQQR